MSNLYQKRASCDVGTSAAVNLFMQIRKLDFIFGEVIKQKCDCVITLGGVGSNHARATAMAARQLGLDSHLFLFTKSDNLEEVCVVSSSKLSAHKYCAAEF